MQNPRRLACLTLVRQEKNGYSNLVLASALTNSGLDTRDKAFVSALFYGTCERINTLDAILAKHLSKPLSKLDAEVRAVLRMGLYQIIYMDSVPKSAAVNEAVKLTRQIGKTSAAGLVNAVLRRACAEDITKLNFSNETERLSILYSVSQPVAKAFCAAFNNDAEAELAATFEKPRLCVRVNTLKTTSEELTERLFKKNIKAQCGTVKNSLYIDFSGDITGLEEFRQGLFHVQGEASQYACMALMPKKGAKVLDLCAAPGGKSATLAQYMQNCGQLISADFAQNRLSLIESLFERNGVSCATICCNDASVYNKEYENADYILCDVPCSGLGIINKKPDIRYKSLENIDELIQLQLQILTTASKYLKKGGRLVYSTCTINKAENDEAVNSFININGGTFARTAPLCLAPPYNFVGNSAEFSPAKSKTDGFYVATLERL